MVFLVVIFFMSVSFAPLSASQREAYRIPPRRPAFSYHLRDSILRSFGCARRFLLFPQPPVPARKVNQRPAFHNTRGHHLSQKDVVVAGPNALYRAALHRGQYTCNQWHSVGPGFPLDAFETVVTPAREAFRNRPLAFRQH